MTGRPELPTPLGSYEILFKAKNRTLTSGYPKGHQYYYDPVVVKYAFRFRNDGYLFHDAPWAPYHGYGTNFPHQDPDGA